MKKIIWGVIAGTKGGLNRARIIDELRSRPYNINQLAEKLDLHYKTVRHHIEYLERNDMVTSTGKKYGTLYFLSDELEENYDSFIEILKEFKNTNSELYVSHGYIH